MNKIDRTDHSPAAKTRPARSRTTAVVLHHLGIDVNKDGKTDVGEAIAFFTRDPEGVATVTLAGTYASKVPTINEWRKAGMIPAAIQAEAFVGYHFLVDEDGVVSRMLPLEAIGAHAGNWNDRSIGIACLGDFTVRAPNENELAGLDALLADVREVYPGIEVLGHDETIIRDGGVPKGCPGKLFPLERFRP